MSSCNCGNSNIKLIYACSGASDVGSLSDLSARKLRDDKVGSMSCLAAVGAGLSGFIESAKAADKCITIDGCAVACARKNLERIGVSPKSFILTEMGYEKGKTPVSKITISEAVSKIKNNICG
ncbi:MAG: putative zinc-binding protein [Spirochaetes bacterium]|nr:putative zinc-binding protein [Spirochaetota bacterium]